MLYNVQLVRRTYAGISELGGPLSTSASLALDPKSGAGRCDRNVKIWARWKVALKCGANLRKIKIGTQLMPHLREEGGGEVEVQKKTFCSPYNSFHISLLVSTVRHFPQFSHRMARKEHCCSNQMP